MTKHKNKYQDAIVALAAMLYVLNYMLHRLTIQWVPTIIDKTTTGTWLFTN